MTDVQQRPRALAAARPGQAQRTRGRRRGDPQEQLGAPGRALGRHRVRGHPLGLVGHRRRPRLRPHALRARARPLPRRPPGRHEGDRVLPRLRPPHLVLPPGRGAVRLQGHPARRLRPHHRDEQPRGGAAGRRGPHLPGQGVLEPLLRGRGRGGHELRAGARAAVRRPRRLRRAACRHLVREQRQHEQPRRGRGPGALRPHRECRRADRCHLRRAHLDHPRQAGRGGHPRRRARR